MEIGAIIQAARGEKPADLVLKHARVVNVFSGEIEETSIAILHSRIVGLGEYEAQNVTDLGASIASVDAGRDGTDARRRQVGHEVQWCRRQQERHDITGSNATPV